MAMQINGNYDFSEISYAERAEKAKETGKETEIKADGKLSELQDEYISSEKSGRKPTGLYGIGQDEDGNRKIFFDDPKAACADGKEPKIGGSNLKKPAEKCVTDTHKVDREIKKLKEKKQQLKQQIQSASGDEKKLRDMERKLALVENELSRKDNDTYRRQNASVSE